MDNRILSLLNTAGQKMSGYAALLNYRFMNLSLEASPEALLSFSVQVDGEHLPLEEVARARNPEGRTDQFEIYPNNPNLITPILQGMAIAHPDYKIELPQIEGSDNPEDRYILATMPEVDDNRHQVLTEAVDLLCQDCDTHMKATYSLYSAQLAERLVTQSPKDQDEAKDQFESLYNGYKDLCAQFRADKEKEIEDAYQAYLAKKSAKDAGNQEDEAAHNQLAGFQMKWNADDE